MCHKRCSYRSDGEYDDVDGIKCQRWSREILYGMKTAAGMIAMVQAPRKSFS